MLKGWKTLIFSAAVALVGVAHAADWIDLLGSETGGYVVTGIGIISAALRFLTNSSVGAKG